MQEVVVLCRDINEAFGKDAMTGANDRCISFISVYLDRVESINFLCVRCLGVNRKSTAKNRFVLLTPIKGRSLLRAGGAPRVMATG